MIKKNAEDFGKIVAVTKSKELKRYAKNILPTYKAWKTQSKLKPIKAEKELGTMYCLGCKDFTHDFKPQEVKMTYKVLREKSDCLVCWSSKSRFLRQKHSNKK